MALGSIEFLTDLGEMSAQYTTFEDNLFGGHWLYNVSDEEYKWSN